MIIVIKLFISVSFFLKTLPEGLSVIGLAVVGFGVVGLGVVGFGVVGFGVTGLGVVASEMFKRIESCYDALIIKVQKYGILRFC